MKVNITIPFICNKIMAICPLLDFGFLFFFFKLTEGIEFILFTITHFLVPIPKGVYKSTRLP